MTPCDPVITALHEQVECYRRLSKLAEVQHEHVRQSETEQLLDLLRRREEVLSRIGGLEQIIGPAKKRWGDYLNGLDSSQRVQAEELVGETRRLLRQIVDADRDDALILQQRKLNIGKQLGQAAAGRQVNKNYAAAAYGARPAGLDRKL